MQCRPPRRARAEAGQLGEKLDQRIEFRHRAEGRRGTMPLRSERQLDAARQLQATRELMHFLLGMSRDFSPRIVECGDDQILQHLDLFGVDQRPIDFHLLKIALAVQRQLDSATAGDTDHLDSLELGLHLGHLLLHRLRLLHQLAEIFHVSSSSAVVSSNGSNTAGVSSASDPVGEKRSRTAAIVDPGKVSSTARTSGCLATSFRTSLSQRSSCSRKVGSPGAACDRATSQRSPVHSPSSWLMRLARLLGAPSAGRNSMRPGSKAIRCTCSRKCEPITASRRLSNSATTSAKLCGIGSYSIEFVGSGSVSSAGSSRAATAGEPMAIEAGAAVARGSEGGTGAALLARFAAGFSAAAPTAWAGKAASDRTSSAGAGRSAT